MDNQNQFGTLKPKLSSCEVRAGDNKILIESEKLQTQVILPRDYLPIIELFDGEKSVEDIAAILYEKEGAVSFNSIIKAIHLLQTSNLIENVQTNFSEIQDEKAPHEQKPSLLIRPFFEITLLKSLDIKFSSTLVFLFICFLVIAGFGGLAYLNYPYILNFDQFLRTPTGYLMGLVHFVAITSALLSLKTLLKVLLTFMGSGKIYHLSLRGNFFSLSLNTNENSLFASLSKFSVLIYGLTMFVSYLFFALLFGFLYPELQLQNEILVIAILLTFIDLDPYRTSDMTKIFYFFYTENQLANMLPYLKNCTINPNSNDKISFNDELRFVIYSGISFLWAVGFILFSIELLVGNLANYIFATLVGSMENRAASGYLGLIFVFTFFYLSIDLLQMLLKNIFSPISNAMSKVSRKGKKVKAKDIDEQFIFESMKKNHLFSDLKDNTLIQIIQKSTLKKLSKKDSLIVQGAIGKEFFVVLKGRVEVNINLPTGKTKKIAVLDEGSVIGEQAIIKKTTRNANVMASEDIEYLEVPDYVLKEMMQDQTYKNELKKILLKIEISHFISSSGLFKDFPPEVMGLFIEAGDLINFPKNHEIVTQGEIDKTFFLLIKGEAEVIKDGEKIAVLGQGDFFGEIALIANTPRTATVKMNEDGLLLYIEAKNFWKLLSSNIDLAMYIESIGRSRMEDK